MRSNPYAQSFKDVTANEKKGKRILCLVCIPVSVANLILAFAVLIALYRAGVVWWYYAWIPWICLVHPIILRAALIPAARKAQALAPNHKECNAYYPRILKQWKVYRVVLIVSLIIVGMGVIFYIIGTGFF